MRLHKSWSDPSKREGSRLCIIVLPDSDVCFNAYRIEMKQQGSYVIEQLKENISSRSGGQSDPDTLVAGVDQYIKTTYLSLYK